MVMTSWQVTIVKWIKILLLKLLAFLCSKLWKGVRPRFQMWQGTNWLLSGKTNIPFHAPEKWGINFVSTLCKLIHFYPLEKHLIVQEPEKRYQCAFNYFRNFFFQEFNETGKMNGGGISTWVILIRWNRGQSSNPSPTRGSHPKAHRKR